MSLFNYYCDEVKRIIDEVSPNYPQLTTYEKEWLYFHKYGYIPGQPVELEYEPVMINPTGSVSNAIPFNYKSAILKGQTLVNCLKPQSGYYTDYQISSAYKDFTLFKPNTLYTFINHWDKGGTMAISSNNGQIINVNFVKNSSTLFTTPNAITNVEIYSVNSIHGGSSSDCEKWKTAFMVIEGDYTNVDIPYFEGMKSVKGPVLKTTGKNLFNKSTITEGVEFNISGFINSEDHFISDFIKVRPNTAYTMSGKTDGSRVHIFDKDKNLIYHPKAENDVIITPDDDRICYMKINGLIEETDTWQLEEGSVATSYEPYQSNILTVNEEVVLRGFDSVEDTLNLNTGEYVKRIGELTLDGSEHWLSAINDDGTMRFSHSISDFKNYGDGSNGKNLINNKLPKVTFSTAGNRYGVSTWCNRVIFYTEHTNVNDFKQWLSQNPTTVQYELETPIVKTVDLTPLNKPYEGVNHYLLTSNIPCEAILEVPVVSTGEQTLQEINNY